MTGPNPQMTHRHSTLHSTLLVESSKPSTQPETNHKQVAPLSVHTHGVGDILGAGSSGCTLWARAFQPSTALILGDGGPLSWVCSQGWLSGDGQWASLFKVRFITQSPMQLALSPQWRSQLRGL